MNNSLRKSLLKISLGALILCNIIFIDKGNAESASFPFDSTWYGYNTQTAGEHYYFISRSKLVDIDNDGDLDVLSSKWYGGSFGSTNGFSVIRNSGSGLFNSQPEAYSSTLASQYIETGDFNNDGFQDVAVSNFGASYQGNSISVYMNLGNGSFGVPANYTVGSAPVGITAADLNGDGKVDLAVANYGYLGQGNTVSVLINSGSGAFNPQVTFPAGNSPYRLISGKINSDNFNDLVIANDNGKVHVLLNSGTGDFSNMTEYTFTLTGSGLWPSVFLADIDNDNDEDILYANKHLSGTSAPGVGVLRNAGGSFSQEVINMNALATGVIDVEAADLNGDGYKDLVGTSNNARNTDGYQVAFNNGSGGFLPAVLRNAGQNTAEIMLGDADNDGKTDILTGDSYSSQITFHKNPGDGNFPVVKTYSTSSSIAGSIDAADIDNDGDLDIVVSASGRAAVGSPVKVMYNNGNGTFGDAVSYSIRGGGVQAKFRDLNGDNKPDILFATAINSPPYDFHYAINNGDGTFGAVQTKSINACGWYDIDAADIDNDGDNDVLITEWAGCQNIPNSGQRLYVVKNLGNAVFDTPLIKLIGPQVAPIGLADFNNDGKIDLATGTSGALVNISLGTGTGDFNAPVNYSIGSQGGATDIVIKDFNRDGKLDIASSDFWENYYMSILYGNGDGTFQAAQILPSAYSPDLLNVSGIAAGDLDNDGDLDIIVGNNASNCFSLYYNNNGTFEYKMRAGGYMGVYSPFYGDFNNDGKGDLVAIGNIPPSGIGSTLMMLKGAATGLTSVTGTSSEIVENYLLLQNYPNPFNPVTNIKFALPVNSFVKLSVYDVSGRLVNQLVNTQLEAGNHSVQFNAASLASGVYFYRLEASSASNENNFVKTMKMVVVK